MANYPATPSEPDWLTEIAVRVRSLLERRASDSPADIYVWSDGTVTGPRDTGDRTDNLRLVATFTPGEEPTAAAIEETVRNGLAAVPRAERLPTVADGA